MSLLARYPVRTASCTQCGSQLTVGAANSIVEFDERSLEQMRLLLKGEFGSLECEGCHKPVEPAIVVWTDRRAHIEIVEGGPWEDGKRSVDVYPQLASAVATSHGAIGEILAKVDSRCVECLELFFEAAGRLGTEESAAWFSEHYSSLGAEIYVAVQLATEGLLSVGIGNASDDAGVIDIDQVLALVQRGACLAMCLRWADFHFEGRRLQDEIDAIVFPSAVSAETPNLFGSAVEAMVCNEVSQPLRIALETTHAWLCRCTGIKNARTKSYTNVMFELEVLATAAAGSLPLVAHACRLDSERLKSTLDARILESAIFDARGPTIADLIETARRLGHPEAARSLLATPTPDWLKALHTPGVLGHVIGMGSEGEVFFTEELTADGVLSPSRELVDRTEGHDSAQSAPCDVFISYSSRDRLPADTIARYLRIFELNVFMDHHTAAGDLWTRKLSDHLYSSRLVLVLWSRNSLHSEWVLKEADIALERGVLMQTLIAPVAVPKRFAHIQSTRLEGWSPELGGPELQCLASDLCSKLGREIPEPAPSLACNILEQYHRIDVVQAAFDYCTTAAWHSFAAPTPESVAPIKVAYDRLKAVLEPVDDRILHELLDRFDLASVCLLAAIVSMDENGLDSPLPVHPHIPVIRTDHSVTMNCEAVQVWQSQFLDALREVTGGTVLHAKRLVPAHIVALPDGVTVEVQPHPRNDRAVGSVTVRAVVT
jgi:hypothetical protein